MYAYVQLLVPKLACFFHIICNFMETVQQLCK